MQREIKNVSGATLVINDLGIELENGSIYDLNNIDQDEVFASNDLFSAIDASQIELLTGFGTITNSSDAKGCFSKVYTLGATININTIETENMTPADEASLTTVFKQVIKNNYNPLMLDSSDPYVWGDCDGVQHIAVMNNIIAASSGITLTAAATETVVIDCESVSGWSAVGATQNANFSADSTINYAGTNSIKVTHTGGKPTDSYGIKYTFGAATNWSSYTHLRFWIYATGCERFYLHINGVIVANSFTNLKSGNQWVTIDISGVARSSVSNVTFWVMPYWQPVIYPVTTNFDSIRGLSAVAYNSSGSFEHVTKITEQNIRYVYYYHYSVVPTGATFTPKISIDDGAHWYNLSAWEIETWLDVTALGISWDNRKNLRLGGNLAPKSDFTASPYVAGYFALYRYE